MLPRRVWKPGDEYWALWIRAEDRRYFPMFEGRVVAVNGDVLELSSGSWRFVDEGFAFASLTAARSFIDAHPFASSFSPLEDENHDQKGSSRPGSPSAPSAALARRLGNESNVGGDRTAPNEGDITL